jgi:hypothetical protein
MFRTINRRGLGVLCALACAAMLGACSQKAALETFSSPEDRALAEGLIHSVQTGDLKGFSAPFDPKLAANIGQMFPKAQQLTPGGPGAVVRLVDAHSSVAVTVGSPGVRRSVLAYEVDQGARHALVRLAIERRAGAAVVTAFDINPIPKPIEEMTAFTLEGRPTVDYVFLALAVLSTLACLAGCAASVVTKRIEPKQRWLWVIGSLLSFSTFTVNWSTGAISIQPIAIQLLGGQVVKHGMLGDWYVGFGMPWVALAMLWPGLPRFRRGK